ncbi:MAG: hypothetical protein KDD47_01015 [Acidobacteria bacterium]|nr:hypothetical protein [Acidobacteriota bacterium]
MSATLTKADFDAQLHQPFQVEAGDTTYELKLIEVQALSESARVPDGREPFSAIFLGPKSPIFGQQIFHLSNPVTGALEIFLVPLGPDLENKGIRYEAVFS